jgi:hypothetical protein
MAKVKDAIETIETLIEQGYSAEYIAGYTGYPVAWVMGYIEGMLLREGIYERS